MEKMELFDDSTSESELEPILATSRPSKKQRISKDINDLFKGSKAMKVDNLRLSNKGQFKRKKAGKKQYKKGELSRDKQKYIKLMDDYNNKKDKYINKDLLKVNKKTILKMPTKYPRNLFTEDYNRNFKREEVIKSKNKVKVNIRKKKLEPVKYIKKETVWCDLCKKEVMNYWHHSQGHEHRINVLHDKSNEDDDYFIKKLGLRRMRPEELGKNGKPKKAFRKSKKYIRNEAREDMLKQYMDIGHVEGDIINKKFMKWVPKYPSPVKDNYREERKEDIIEPTFL